MLRIAIDFDSTLFPTCEKVIEIYNKQHNDMLQLSQITTYNFSDCLDQNIADELIELFCDNEVYDNLLPYKGSIKSIKTLVEQGHEVYVATSTDIRNMGWKEELLRKHFPFIPKKNLIRIHNKALLDVDVMIEDKMENLTQTFASRICYDQPWNRDAGKDFAYSIYRIRHWGEVNNIINELERKNKEWKKK